MGIPRIAGNFVLYKREDMLATLRYAKQPYYYDEKKIIFILGDCTPLLFQ